jgi:pimeloyl-ACP methyl ester carboxylesterase
VRRLVLVAPAGVPSPRSPTGDALALLHMAVLAGPRFWPRLLADARRAGLRALYRAAGHARSDDALAAARAIVAPTLLLWGDRDTLTPRADVERLAAAISGARIDTLPGVGHVALAERPDALARSLLDFLEG